VTNLAQRKILKLVWIFNTFWSYFKEIINAQYEIKSTYLDTYERCYVNLSPLA
jgi:hypothetical protein